MEKNDVKLNFINLRLNSVPLREIATKLNISESTAFRWNKKFSEEIINLKTQNEHIANEKLNSKIDSYLNLYEKYFKIFEKELDYYQKKNVPMSFDFAEDYSQKMFKSIQMLLSMKKSIRLNIHNDDLKLAFLSAVKNSESENLINEKSNAEKSNSVEVIESIKEFNNDSKTNAE